jgi:hypothetical protein
MKWRPKVAVEIRLHFEYVPYKMVLVMSARIMVRIHLHTALPRLCSSNGGSTESPAGSNQGFGKFCCKYLARNVSGPNTVFSVIFGQVFSCIFFQTAENCPAVDSFWCTSIRLLGHLSLKYDLVIGSPANSRTITMWQQEIPRCSTSDIHDPADSDVHHTSHGSTRLGHWLAVRDCWERIIFMNLLKLGENPFVNHRYELDLDFAKRPSAWRREGSPNVNLAVTAFESARDMTSSIE